MTAPAFRPIHTLAADIMARRLSPVDLVDECLSRIERLEPKLHAFVSVNRANARLAAEAAHKAIYSGHAVGPLHGIPIAIKDLVEIEGEVVTGGSAAWQHRKATRTATLMRKLLGAGMINLGKTHTVEFAYGVGDQPASWYPMEPMGCHDASDAGRLVFGFRGCGRRASGTLRDRH